MKISTNPAITIHPRLWQPLRSQLLQQWERITAGEIDQAGPNRHRIALLVRQKYGIAPETVETYLRNFERTMPELVSA